MGYVAVTVGFAALGAYLGRDLSGAIGLLLLIATIPVVIGLHVAATKSREQLAIGLLFGLGLVLGLAVAPSSPATPTVTRPRSGRRPAPPRPSSPPPAPTDTPRAETSAVGPRALLGVSQPDRVRDRRDLVSIPDSNIIYTVAGLGIFGAFTIFDFNRLRRSTLDAAVPIAAGIALDAFNVFLLVLDLFGGRLGDRALAALWSEVCSVGTIPRNPDSSLGRKRCQSPTSAHSPAADSVSIPRKQRSRAIVTAWRRSGMTCSSVAISAARRATSISTPDR
jgi:hypothetical protein